MNRYDQLFSSPIGLDVARCAGDTSTVFVFPSQDSADSWADALLRSGRLDAVALDRFFGFEHFIRFCALSAPQGEAREARPLDRWIWALGALPEFGGAREGADSLNSEAKSSITRLTALVNLVPCLYENANLARVSEAATSSPFAFIRAQAEELVALADHFRAFLRKREIFDGHFPPFSFPPGLKVRAYGLEEEFARLGFAGLEFPRVTETPRQGSASPGDSTAGTATLQTPEYYEFDSFLSELEWALGSIAEEIEAGTEAEDIVLSVCRLNSQKAAWIRQISARLGVKASIRWGEPLSGTPFGRLLGALQSAAAEGLTLESLDAFASFASVRARDPEGWKALRDGALKAHVPNTSPHAPYIHQLWKESFQSGLLPESTARRYTQLWNDISNIAGAPSFASLYGELLSFMERWVDTTAFGSDTRTDKSMRMALHELQSWVASEETAPIPSGFAPFELFLAELNSKAYIPLLEAGALRVYDAQASSGMACLSHYILGASQSGFTPLLSQATALPASLSALIEAGDQDRAPRALAMHSVSRALFSYAREGFEGYEVALPQLGEPSRTAPRGSARRGAQPAATARAAPSTTGQLSQTVAARALEATKSLDPATGLPVFSPHSLKERAQCGFRWFSQKLRLEDSYARDDSALLIGNFLHEAYERAAKRAAGARISGNLDGRADAGEGENTGMCGQTNADDGGGELGRAREFSEALDAALRSSAAKILSEAGPALRPTLAALTEKARHRLTALWEFERAVFGEYPEREFERDVALAFETEGALLHGRIDCVFSRVDDSLGGVRRSGIIDYKKNRIPTLSEMKPKAPEAREDYAEEESDDSEEPSLALREIQIPSYALILESMGEEVEGALYWSIEKAKPAGYIRPAGSDALPKPISAAYRDAADTGPARSALRRMLADAASALARGDLLDRAADRASCADCAFAPLCRYWYFLELR